MARSRQLTLQALIECYVDTQHPDLSAKQASSARAISQEVAQGRLTIQTLVTMLGTYLTTTDNVVRARGTLLLSDILADLLGISLEETAIKSLTNFYCARLGDWHCLRGAILGSLSLLSRSSKVGSVDVEAASQVAKSALANLHVQALAQRDRMLCLELFECLLEKHGDAVAPLEGDLVFGVVAAIEEEKDPRCLLVAFRIIQLLARLYPDPDGPVSSCADELFDVLSRYFPISFNAQPGTPDCITREDLRTALKETFACTQIFAPFCIPLLLEKLSSSLRTAKLDSLNYLGHCGFAYGGEALRKYTDPVWKALKAEILPFSVPLSSASLEPLDIDIVQEALSCLSSWALAFEIEKRNDAGITEAGDFLQLVLQDGFVEDLISCLENSSGSQNQGEPALSDLAKYQSEAAGHILAEFARACPSSCFVICGQVLPRLMAATGLATSIGASSGMVISCQDRDRCESVIGLDIVLQIVTAARSLAETFSQQLDQSSAMTSKKWLDPLREQSENLITAFHQAITDKWSKPTAVPGVDGLQALASFPAFLSPLSSNQLRRTLLILKTLLNDGTEQKLLEHVFTALEKISSFEERSGTMDSVGILSVVVPDLLEAVREGKTGTVVENPLWVLVKICGPRSVARQLMIRHLTGTIRLDLLAAADENDRLDEICAKMVVVLQRLSEDVLPWCDSQIADQSDIMALSMEIWTIVSAQAIKYHQEILHWSMKVMRVAVLKCDAKTQSKILQNGVEHLLDTTSHNHEEEMDWSIALVASVIVSLWPSVVIPNKQTVLITLMRPAQSEKPFLITETAAQAVASILNKWVAVSTDEDGGFFNLETAVKMVLSEGCLSEIFCNSNWAGPDEIDFGKEVPWAPGRQNASAVRAAAWIGKGLAMRGHSGVFVVASALLRLLLLLSEASGDGTEFSLAMGAAEGLGIILRDSEAGLNKAHHAVVRPLYKQRFFKSTLPYLLKAVRSARDTAAKLWLYRGIGHLISGTPHAALLADGPIVFPLILGTLSFLSSDRCDLDLLLSTLLALSAFIFDPHQGMSAAGEHVSSIVKQMLTLIQYEYSGRVRETALRCLGAAVGLSYARAYPSRTKVLKAISAALDDKKRVVRKEAVRCFQAWSLTAAM